MKTKTLFIPKVGQTLTLAKDWTFELDCRIHYSLTSSYKILDVLDPQPPFIKDLVGSAGRLVDDSSASNAAAWEQIRQFICLVTVPADTEIKIEKIYVRKNNLDYEKNDLDSLNLTFIYNGKKVRVCINLNDINTMEIKD